MRANYFLKFCDNIEYEKTYVADEEVFVDLDYIEEELRKSIYVGINNGIFGFGTNWFRCIPWGHFDICPLYFKCSLILVFNLGKDEQY